MGRARHHGPARPPQSWPRRLLPYSAALAVAFVDLLQGDYGGAIFVSIGILIIGVLMEMVGRLAWQQGYWNARGEMWASLDEAQRRGISAGEWMQAQRERDIQNLS